ncbi:MAG: hypothetical protein V3T70_08710, partial [Phycisphaerae bacterium]
MERNRFAVGVLLIAIIALFFGVMMFIPSWQQGGEMRTISVRFPHGYRLPLLESGSVVLAGGQRIGLVTSADIDEQPVDLNDPSGPKDLFVVLAVEIRGDLELREDCRFIPEGPPLGGSGILILELGESSDLLADGAVVEGGLPSGFAAVLQSINQTLGVELDGDNPASLLGLIKTQLDVRQKASLMKKLHRSMDDFNAVTRNVRVQMDPDQSDALFARLNAVMDNLNAVSAALRTEMDADRDGVLLAKIHATLDVLSDGLASVAEMVDETRQPLQQTMTHLASTARIVDTQIVAGIAEQTDASNTAGLLAKANTAVDHLNDALANLSEVASTARDVTVLNRDNINDMIRNLRQTSDHLKSAIKFVLRRPWLLFNEPTLVETRQKDILDATSNFQ